MYLSAMKNPIFTLLKITFSKPPWDVTLRTNEKRRIHDKNDLFETVYLLNHPFKGTEVQYTVKNTDVAVKLKTVKGNDGSEVFEKDSYLLTLARDQILPYIRANICDSQLYFYCSTAKYIFAIRTNNRIPELIFRNSQQNNCKRSINLETLIVFTSKIFDEIIVRLLKQNTEYVTECNEHLEAGTLITFQGTLQENKIESAALNLDTEGCEHDILLLANFKTIRRLTPIRIVDFLRTKSIKYKVTESWCGVTVYPNKTTKLLKFTYLW